MGEFDCVICQVSFDHTLSPHCPHCLVERWLRCKTFIRSKHDPGKLPLRWESYRSVLSPALTKDPRPFLEDAAARGCWYFDVHYEMNVHFTHEPLGRSPGSGIPEGQTMPEHALDSLLIAEADSATEAHAFATSKQQFDAQRAAGEFVPLAECPESECPNRCLPGRERCIVHVEQKPEPTRAGTLKR